MVEAWRTLAIISTRPGQGEALFHFASSLSRRDVPTQLWLIEDAVRKNDIPGALSHYDAALRSSLASQQISAATSSAAPMRPIGIFSIM